MLKIALQNPYSTSSLLPYSLRLKEIALVMAMASPPQRFSLLFQTSVVVSSLGSLLFQSSCIIVNSFHGSGTKALLAHLFSQPSTGDELIKSA